MFIPGCKSFAFYSVDRVRKHQSSSCDTAELDFADRQFLKIKFFHLRERWPYKMLNLATYYSRRRNSKMIALTKKKIVFIISTAWNSWNVWRELVYN